MAASCMPGSESGDLVPYAPLDLPKPFGDDIWIVDGPEIRFDYLGLSLPFPTRMTVVRLSGGDLWLHSPTKPSEALLARIRDLGQVGHLVAPNSLHYWHVPEWKQHFPGALVHAAPGLAESAKRPLPIDQELGAAPPREWIGEIDQLLVPGSMMTEVDFFHRASRTLILTDLIENFEPRRVRNRWYRWLLRLGGAADPDGKAPIDMRLSFIGRRKGVRAAAQQMIAWAPDRIVLAHGRCYEQNAVSELRRAFRWVL